MVQWLGLHALTAEGPGSIPGRGTKIPQAMRFSHKKKKEGLLFLIMTNKNTNCDNNYWTTCSQETTVTFRRQLPEGPEKHVDSAGVHIHLYESVPVSVAFWQGQTQ